MKNKKIRILVGLVAVVVLLGLVWLKTAYQDRVQPVVSKADETPPHWRHSSLPFTLTLNNYASKYWGGPLSTIGAKWGAAGALQYEIVKGEGAFQCYPIVIPLKEGMNVCSINEDNGWLAVAGYMQGPDDSHIIGGIVALNDAYLNNPKSEYATEAWRNKMLCEWLGWTAGVPFRLDPAEESNSCMNIYYDSETVAKQQFPNSADYTALKSAYGHLDRLFTPDPISERVGIAGKSVSQGQLGQLVKSYNAGQTESYVLDLGNGYTLKTFIQKVSK